MESEAHFSLVSAFLFLQPRISFKPIFQQQAIREYGKFCLFCRGSCLDFCSFDESTVFVEAADMEV